VVPAVKLELAIPGYEILEKIGQGGMGAVYRARQISLGREVAIKTLLPQFADDEQFAKRFKREALAAAALEHANIFRIYDVGRLE